jgi:hypothetical protein
MQCRGREGAVVTPRAGLRPVGSRGLSNTASGYYVSASWGRNNHATASYASVSGGAQNVADGEPNAVDAPRGSGGYQSGPAPNTPALA